MASSTPTLPFQTPDRFFPSQERSTEQERSSSSSLPITPTPAPRPKRSNLDASCVSNVQVKYVRNSDQFVNNALTYLETRVRELETQLVTAKAQKKAIEDLNREMQGWKNKAESPGEGGKEVAVRKDGESMELRLAYLLAQEENQQLRHECEENQALKMEHERLLRKHRELSRLCDMPEDPEGEMDYYFGYNGKIGRCDLNGRG